MVKQKMNIKAKNRMAKKKWLLRPRQAKNNEY